MKSDSFKNNRKALAALLLCTGFIAAHPLAMRAESSGPGVQTVQQQQQIKVTGTVNDDMGPVIGASVVEKGNPSNGTITDIDGNFSLSVKPGATLLISYIGYKSQEVQAISGKSVNITLKEDTEMLDEVVVVGFGTQKKVNLTGAVGTLSSDELKERPVANATQALQGLVPGLNIDVTNGSLESRPDINIRGTATIGEGTSGAPLILIDGMEGELHSINPQDIANISVLKDAAASSIYGSRAPFGVVLITTKSGTKDGKTSINYNNSFRFGSPINKKEMMNSVQFASWVNDALTNNGGSPRFNEAYMDRLITWQNAKPYALGQRMTADGTIVYPIEAQASGQWYGGFSTGADDVNYYDVVYKDHTFSQEHNVSASGGSKKFNYYASGSYFDQDGLLNVGEENLQRFTATAKINSEITDWLKFNMNMRFTREDYVRPSALTDYFYEALAFKAWPILPLYDRNGYYYYSDDTSVAALAEGGSDKKQTDHFYFQTGLEIEPVKNWVTSVDFNYRIKSANRHWDSQPYINHDLSGAPYYRKSSSNVHEDYLKENYFNFNARSEYSFSLADSHNFHILGGFQAENLKQNLFGLQRNGIMINSKPEVDLTNGLDIDGNPITPSVNGGRNEWSTVGFFGRLNYDYKGRYLFEVNVRADGSSRFRKGNQWKTFPSASVGWNIAQEEFFKPLSSTVDMLKIRGSYGKMGDDGGASTYPQTVIAYNIEKDKIGWFYNGALMAGVAATAIPNPDLTWYTAETYNLGLDFDLWNQKLSGTFEVFKRKRSGLLATSSTVVPGTVGASLPQENLNSDQTFGWEISLNHRNRVAGVNYWVGGQISATKNRWDYRLDSQASNSMDAWRRRDVSGRNKDIWFSYEEGGRFSSYEQIRYHDLTGGGYGQGTLPGDYYYKDWNGDGIINGEDNHPMASYNLPVFNYGFVMGADWKGIDVSMNWQGAAGVYNSYDEVFTEVGPFNGGAVLDIYLDRWHTVNPSDDPFNPNTKWVSGLYPATGHSFSNAGTGIKNTSYLRLKTLEVGYTLPKTWIAKAGIQNLRIYFNAYNLLTFTGLDNIDPERPGRQGGANNGDSSGILFYNYPVNRTFNIGATIKF